MDKAKSLIAYEQAIENLHFDGGACTIDGVSYTA